MTPSCPHCNPTSEPRSRLPFVVRIGRFYRRSDARWIQRFKCRGCERGFSHATFQPCYRQNKRQYNEPLKLLLVSGVSLRRSARNLKLSRTTVARKLKFLGERARLQFKLHAYTFPKVSILEFDDLETFEHSKMKPVSVTLAVEYRTRRILGLEVARMSAKGKLASRSREKYGRRKDERRKARRRLFERLRFQIEETAEIKSDENPYYVQDVIEFFPRVTHRRFKGLRGCVTGQGELKRGQFDPLFSLNHTCAMFRANVNRLFRKTWCTTKKIERLADHLAIYAVFHNTELI